MTLEQLHGRLYRRPIVVPWVNGIEDIGTGQARRVLGGGNVYAEYVADPICWTEPLAIRLLDQELWRLAKGEHGIDPVSLHRRDCRVDVSRGGDRRRDYRWPYER